MTPEEIMCRPYHWVFVRYGEGWHAVIAELPGCIATGDTAAEALRNLQEVMHSWLTIVLEKGQAVPEPWPALAPGT